MLFLVYSQRKKGKINKKEKTSKRKGINILSKQAKKKQANDLYSTE